MRLLVPFLAASHMTPVERCSQPAEPSDGFQCLNTIGIAENEITIISASCIGLIMCETLYSSFGLIEHASHDQTYLVNGMWANYDSVWSILN